ncbi:MAG TPA: NUMOD3 domain-containing DNA-binding protein [Candidatus Acidoferrum sp.]|nr:NUMOD3 domain-containing DNA-binding protein [Candidatus Acidoferrum sp.]
MKHYVYYHIDPTNKQIKYVGKGSGNRAYETRYRRSTTHLEWAKNLYDQGLCPIIEIVKFFDNEVDAYEEEKELINKLKNDGLNLFNRTPGGMSLSGSDNPMYGRKRPDTIIRNKTNKGKNFEDLYGNRANEIKAKMGKSGENNGAFGLKRPDLSKRNRQAKGKTLEEIHGSDRAKEIRSKLSVATAGEANPMYGKSGKEAPCFGRTGNKHPMYGKTQTQETKSKISNSLKLSRGKPIIRSDGKPYISLIDAAKELGFKDQKEITKVLKGLRSHINGFTFQYVT